VAEWTRVEVPKLSIIPDELWEKVQAVNQQGHDKYFATRLGGMNRTAASRKYLFSGIMVCGFWLPTTLQQSLRSRFLVRRILQRKDTDLRSPRVRFHLRRRA
jgi:hypothetical protein